MGRSRRNRKELQALEITAIAAEGRGLGRQEGKVIFVDYGIPGDVVDIRLTKNKKDYAEGNITNLVSASKLRQDSFCELFGLCGGCRWQHISYEQQIAYKHNIVEESFRRIGKLTDYELQSILGCSLTRGYRNKMEYTFSNQCWLTEEQIKSGEEIDRRAVGFHVSGQARRVINIEKCYLQDDFGNKIRNSIYEFSTANDISFYDHYSHEGFLRNLILRNTTLGEIMLVLCVGSNDQEWIDKIMNFVQERFPELTSINYVVNEKLNDTIYDLEVINFAGKDHIIEQLGEVKYRIGPKSFFQTNSHQAKNLFDLIVEYAAIQPTDLVYDLYCGIGSIGLYVAHLAKEVVGVETVPEAIEDAKLNMNLNGITNTKFHAGSSERILSNEFLNENGRPDIVITDPPRAGMHKDVVEFLLRAEPQKIVYVSCNPVTQARDIQLLQEKYTLVKARPVDMFPHTYHVENVALLVRR